ncbi:conserved hypothetical protein [Ricinus communis]|uniref:F-box associated beta-propeller type 1 domain-containing protein n=1 Tax=Ricinus communis TaxID=3988 RepID=B9T366_RICCO|nr:conserved hypothetical protein [Ricinus communis]
MLSPAPSFDIPGVSGTNYFGFGFNSRTNDYKVLRVDQGIHSVEVVLYSLNSNSWKKISNLPRKCSVNEYATPALSNDALHWPVEVEGKNLVFKCLGSVKVTELTVKAFGESSIVVIYQNDWDHPYESDIWVMKEHGAWTKLATVGKRWRGSSKVLEFRNNGEVLVQFYRGHWPRIT